MTFSFAAKAGVLLVFFGSVLFVHLRGKARLPVLRQFVNHSALFAPYNALMYLFSGVPSKPYLDRQRFPELDVLKDNWQEIREEAMRLFDEATFAPPKRTTMPASVRSSRRVGSGFT